MTNVEGSPNDEMVRLNISARFKFGLRALSLIRHSCFVMFYDTVYSRAETP